MDSLILKKVERCATHTHERERERERESKMLGFCNPINSIHTRTLHINSNAHANSNAFHTNPNNAHANPELTKFSPKFTQISKKFKENFTKFQKNLFLERYLLPTSHLNRGKISRTFTKGLL